MTNLLTEAWPRISSATRLRRELSVDSAKSKMHAKERQEFRDLLTRRRAILASDVNNMQDNALNKNGTSSGDLSKVPYHMADVGTDNFEHEFTLGLIENEEEELREIDEALARLAKDDFGVCESCSEPIPKSRLKVIPYARLCIECKQKEESGKGH